VRIGLIKDLNTFIRKKAAESADSDAEASQFYSIQEKGGIKKGIAELC